ncbi:MAG: hypothetical protein LC635_01470 [Pseudonocardiaceae bacterium]|nr:hypothetical protein [Pseudonocardiaceae bacterium]
MTRVAGVLAVVVLALAGCTVSRSGAPAPGTTATLPTTLTTTLPTTTTTPPAPTAQDGADFQACADGTCEVAIAGPASIPLPGGSLVVSAVLEDGIEFDLTSAAGGGSGSLRGYCTATFGGGGGGMECPADGPAEPATATPGLLTVQIRGVSDGAVVVRIVS